MPLLAWGGMPPLAIKLPIVATVAAGHPVRSVALQSAVEPIWGGRDSVPMLSYNTSYAMPKPPRTDQLGSFFGVQAKPRRGMKSVFGACGAAKVINPGSLAMLFRLICVQP